MDSLYGRSGEGEEALRAVNGQEGELLICFSCCVFGAELGSIGICPDRRQG